MRFGATGIVTQAPADELPRQALISLTTNTVVHRQPARLGLRGFSLEVGRRLGLRSGGSVGSFSVGRSRPSSDPPVPGNPLPRAYFSTAKARGNSARFSGKGLGLQGPQPPKTMTRGQRFTVLGWVWRDFQKLGDKQNHGTFGTFANPAKVQRVLNPRPRAVQWPQAFKHEGWGRCTPPSLENPFPGPAVDP